ncbi:Mn2+-dependent serine/threonine protein kinase [Methanocella conradii HZ254]|uniref:Mn2+-dependent serine/threonine protein kinase n=1 Tax=Methanocella conradii (strain DSM 24694 / JCM 17849 / CGMCC 1.5162 / HZ254) TaxID=1041930 RepID=H8I5F8_METCZ|nr:phosphotransferase [Methanocella conradii]AFC98852.1 Mn2+-dependent serine/threonine protein kinase [Methanocella conradii HZ254]
MIMPFEGLTIIKKFPSRKNAVYLVERGGWRLVLKVYGNDRRKNEADVLRSALKAGIRVPEIIEEGESALLMEFIPGRLANDYLETCRIEEIALGVADWLAGFHKAFRSGDSVLLKSDAILKNFIVSDSLYGIDFELSRIGRPEEDVGEALAYLLDTRPMFADDKLGLCQAFIERYERGSGIGLKGVDAFVARSLREAAGFRPAQRGLLMRKAAEIEESRPFTRCRR